MMTVSRVAKKKTKPTLEATVEILAQIAEKHLASMPQEEQQERVAALSRRSMRASGDQRIAIRPGERSSIISPSRTRA
jgi:hypothetical protein